MRTHIHSEKFDKSAEEVFKILITPSAIRVWWGASRAIVIPEKGGIWAASWGDEDNPEYVSSFLIDEINPPHLLRFVDAKYTSTDGGLPFEAEFVTTFEVLEHDDGTELRVTQEGFPDGSEADEYYSACETGWKDTFAGIRKFLKSG